MNGPAALPAQRLPLMVIGGFLGSGKTTLLNRVLAGSAGRLAVLVNDFGAINIDATLVAERSDDVISLTNGCVCCSIGDDLTGALIRVLETQPPFDAIVIEASGVADPWRIAQVGLADPALALDSVIVLVDAASVLEHASDPLLADSLQRQLRAADLVVLNKTDLVDAAQCRRVREWVTAQVGDVLVHETAQAEVPLPLLGNAWLDGVPAARGERHAEMHAEHAATATEIPTHDEHDHRFEAWSCRPQHVLSTEGLRDWLRRVPAGVLRLKGLLRTDEHGWSELQFAGRHGSLRRAAPPADGAAVVAIGLRGRLPIAALTAVFEAPTTGLESTLL